MRVVAIFEGIRPGCEIQELDVLCAPENARLKTTSRAPHCLRPTVQVYEGRQGTRHQGLQDEQLAQPPVQQSQRRVSVKKALRYYLSPSRNYIPPYITVPLPVETFFVKSPSLPIDKIFPCHAFPSAKYRPTGNCHPVIKTYRAGHYCPFPSRKRFPPSRPPSLQEIRPQITIPSRPVHIFSPGKQPKFRPIPSRYDFLLPR